MRAIIFLMLVFSASAAFAVTAPITVPSEGNYYYWFSYTDAKGDTIQTTPRSFKDKKTTAELPLVKDAVPKCKLYVLDGKSGNEAVIEIEAKKGEPLKFDLKPADFDTVRRVEITVLGAVTGRPAAACIVKLEDDRKKVQIQTIDPMANGVARFLDVASGTARITIKYGEDRISSQDIDIPLDRDEAVAHIDVPIAGDIETLEASAPTKTPEEAGEAPETPRRIGNRLDWLTGFIGLLLFIGIVYGAYVLMRNRGARFQEILRKMGVEVQPEQAPPSIGQAQPPSPPVDPTICPFCGGKKDPATGACACTVGTQAGTPTQSPASGPRLVVTQGSYMGSIYQISAGGTTIGRDESNDIAFAQDPTTSRRHAKIEVENGTFKIIDLGSSNGTFVNGVKVTDQVLCPGDEIQIGSNRLRFEA
ncbi:MAG: FHA domain-containing protein [Armatimonadota bacterium]|nr:FHA domain-containing protein [Armatimonadota bacterium]